MLFSTAHSTKQKRNIFSWEFLSSVIQLSIVLLFLAERNRTHYCLLLLNPIPFKAKWVVWFEMPFWASLLYKAVICILVGHLFTYRSLCILSWPLPATHFGLRDCFCADMFILIKPQTLQNGRLWNAEMGLSATPDLKINKPNECLLRLTHLFFFKDAVGVNAGGGVIVTGRKER